MDPEFRLLLDRPTHEDWPSVRCPTCLKGHLAPVPKGLKRVKSGDLQRYFDSDGEWEPDFDEGVFTMHLRCSLKTCIERVVTCGTYQVRFAGSRDDRYELVLHPSAFVPPLALISVPAKVPDDVRKSLQQASAVIWADPSAAANRLRVAVEGLLTHQRVRKTTPTKKGGTEPLKTHARILKLKAEQPAKADAAEVLMSVKWIGNDGSHGDLSGPDVLDGLELLEHAMELLYDPRPNQLKARARKINLRKTPRPKAP